MTLSTGVGRGHGRHHHGPLGPRGTKPSVARPPTVKSVTASPPSAKPPKAKGVGRGHGKHHHGPNPKAHHSHKKKVK